MRAPLRYVGNREERSVSVKVFTEKDDSLVSVILTDMEYRVLISKIKECLPEEVELDEIEYLGHGFHGSRTWLVHCHLTERPIKGVYCFNEIKKLFAPQWQWVGKQADWLKKAEEEKYVEV